MAFLTFDNHIDRQIKPYQPAEKKLHVINVKGYFSKSFSDAQTGLSGIDISYGNGQILFNGTLDELEVYENYLVENEGKFGFKII